jgi:peptide chain release factor 3
MSHATLTDGEVVTEARRRRTFAVISHPDAGKSTLTEALALHARVIGEAGAVHGKAGRKGVVSDWMEMEKTRGISITSAALQFEYTPRHPTDPDSAGTSDHDAVVINLLDTPGHADFSEDTYRVLAAVDCAVMLLDAAAGLEPQTLKLFDVCRHRGIPVITFINKWDRPGKHALDLCDELETRIGLTPTPLMWPVGEAGYFTGLLDRRAGTMSTFKRAPGGARISEERTLTPAEAQAAHAEEWRAANDEVGLLSELDLPSFHAGRTTPLLFGAAVANIGVRHLLETLAELAPPPSPRPDKDGDARELDEPFSGYVFKVQAGMDRAHRDRVAFVRVCSGKFERGSVVTHAGTGRPFATKYAQAMFGRDRETLDVAYPGDIIGLVNASALTPGATLYAESAPVEFPPIPSFAPEHFAVVRAKDTGKSKQFRKGIAQLEQEGVVQVLRSDLHGDAAPIMAAVGPLQFEVSAHRMEHEFSAAVTLEHLPYSLARVTSRADVGVLDAERGCEVAERGDGVVLALFTDRWRMESVRRSHPTVVLEPLVADAER